MLNQMQVIINEETIKQADNRGKGGRPRKGESKAKPFKNQGYRISDDACEAIRRAAERLGVTQSALVEALGRSLSEQQIAA